MPKWLLRPRNAVPLCWAVLAFTLGCSGPRDATPLPEPPALTPKNAKATKGMGPTLTTDRGPISITAEMTSGSAGAAIRATNLETQAPPVVSAVAADGSFDVNVVAREGDELRLEVERQGLRSAPIDYLFAPSGELMPSTRFACVSAVPGLELAFEAPSQRLTLENGCATPLQVSGPRTRLGLGDFTLTSALPATVAAGEVTELSLQFSATETGPREDVLFLNLADGTRTIRYPFTLYSK